MCTVIVEPSRKAQLEIRTPIYDPTYDAHMAGQWHGTSVTGMHSLYGLVKGTNYRITDDHIVPDANSHISIFSAKVRLLKAADRFGNQEASDEKLSSFWPTDMCGAHVKDAITAAWKDWKKNGGTPEYLTVSRRAGPGIKWVGKVKLKTRLAGGGRTARFKASVIWVGCPETGDSSASPILSAFPAINGKFF
jgi:hypothetical protein